MSGVPQFPFTPRIHGDAVQSGHYSHLATGTLTTSQWNWCVQLSARCHTFRTARNFNCLQNNCVLQTQVKPVQIEKESKMAWLVFYEALVPAVRQRGHKLQLPLITKPAIGHGPSTSLPHIFQRSILILSSYLFAGLPNGRFPKAFSHYIYKRREEITKSRHWHLNNWA
jgi:hypothetical protein